MGTLGPKHLMYWYLDPLGWVLESISSIYLEPEGLKFGHS